MAPTEPSQPVGLEIRIARTRRWLGRPLAGHHVTGRSTPAWAVAVMGLLALGVPLVYFRLGNPLLAAVWLAPWTPTPNQMRHGCSTGAGVHARSESILGGTADSRCQLGRGRPAGLARPAACRSAELVPVGGPSGKASSPVADILLGVAAFGLGVALVQLLPSSRPKHVPT